MFRSFVLLASAVLAFGAQSALSCPPAELKIKDLTFNADGVATRSILVKREPTGQKADRGAPTFVPAVRDMIQLEVGDRVILNADPLAVDALFEVEATLHDKEFDEQGTMYSTFAMRETTYFTFGSIKYKASEKTYKAKITSNYVGEGKYGKHCGQVIRSDVFETQPEQPSDNGPTIPSQPET